MFVRLTKPIPSLPYPAGTLFELMPDYWHDWELLRYRVRKDGKMYLIPMCNLSQDNGEDYAESATKG